VIVTKITKNDWLTFSALSIQTSIAEPTLRRYAKLFGRLVRTTTRDRVIHFEPRAVEVFKEAARLYAQGLRTEAVRLKLQESHGGRIVEVDTVEDRTPAPVSALDQDSTIRQAALVYAAKGVSELRGQLKDLRGVLASQQQEIGVLKAKKVEGEEMFKLLVEEVQALKMALAASRTSEINPQAQSEEIIPSDRSKQGFWNWIKPW